MFGLQGVSAAELLGFAYGVPSGQFQLSSALPRGLYSLTIHFPQAANLEGSTVVQEAVQAALHLDVQKSSSIQKALVLQVDPTGHHPRLDEAASTGASAGQQDGQTLRLMNTSMKQLANRLSEMLDMYVMNATEIEGGYDLELTFATGDLQALECELAKYGIVATLKDWAVPTFHVDHRD